MTYCVAVHLDSGILFASDSRTNAGVDRISTFTKLKVFERPDDRVLVLLSAGNLAVTQNVLHILEQQRNADPEKPSIWSADNLFDVAGLVGDALREVQRRHGAALAQDNIDGNASLILGGQIKGEEQRLFNIYPQGNFIQATEDTPFLQLGESKYGKPILDRNLTYQMSLDEALRCSLISFDSTIRSNLSVGMPLDLLVYRKDAFGPTQSHRINQDDPYYAQIRNQWCKGLRDLLADLPAPPQNYMT